MIIRAAKQLAFEYRRNPNAGTVAWVLHRLAGLSLLAYMIVHMWVLSSALNGADAMTSRLSMVQSTLFHFLEIGLIAIILYHTFNGVRIILADALLITRTHKVMSWLTYLFTAAGTAYAAYLIIPRTLAH
jgi:succinate dehydrogenase / fumarate reductase cytochrome b subunit